MEWPDVRCVLGDQIPALRRMEYVIYQRDGAASAAQFPRSHAEEDWRSTAYTDAIRIAKSICYALDDRYPADSELLL